MATSKILWYAMKGLAFASAGAILYVVFSMQGY